MEIPPNLPSAPAVEAVKRVEATERKSAESSASSVQTSASTQDLKPTPPPPEPDRAEVERAVESLNASAQAIHRNLRFAVDDATGRTVITLSDSQSGEVIRQIPSDSVLRLAERLASEGASAAEGRSVGRARYQIGPSDGESLAGALLDAEF